MRIEKLTVDPFDLKMLRLSYSLTQAEAAALLGVHKKTWEAWEQGTNPMRRYTMDAFIGYAEKNNAIDT